eukprot:14227613-Alexandrium_andersonii.AAC.1
MEWLRMFRADEASAVSHHPRLAEGDPQLAPGSVVGVARTCDRKMGGGGELGLIRPPAPLDADE